MLNLIKIYWILFGVLAAAGGYMGYSKAGSVASLVAGGICGVLMVVAGLKCISNRKLSVALAAFVGVALLGRSLPAYLKTQNAMPHIPLIVMSVVSLGLALVRWRKI